MPLRVCARDGYSLAGSGQTDRRGQVVTRGEQLLRHIIEQIVGQAEKTLPHFGAVGRAVGRSYGTGATGEGKKILTA